ncbi:hypothetical protein KL925_004918 [Ogataea polymorpha]|nr:hypothetical protein KL936_004555 [Ogataea polymorpha]KAG7893859.1 hypothetical protein KL908_002136 [Ogataea polymorpha]KAG7925076.1 hypothetical protein KL925_004918 [Ogataea polymorpha]KAG7930506.1 hypothetical protein KL934_004579 [Ogataea polymorpha]KAG7932067.1 hypothetical protein KL904_004492 [Ogataea polymorpha]
MASETDVGTENLELGAAVTAIRALLFKRRQGYRGGSGSVSKSSGSHGRIWGVTRFKESDCELGGDGEARTIGEYELVGL